MAEQITWDMLVKGILIFIRTGGVLFCLPVFGDNPTPVRIRLFLAFGLSMIFYPLTTFNSETILAQYTDVISWVWLIFKELFIGFVIGIVTKLSFDAILLGANMVGYQMGFGTANLFIPDANEQLNGFTALHRIIVILLFFSLNLHHFFLQGMADSFALIPLGEARLNPALGEQIIQLSAGMFEIAMQLAAPILVALLFTMAALGLMARTVPQLNVFTISFPASFFVGLVIYMATFAFFPEWMHLQFGETQQQLIQALLDLSPNKP